MTGKELFLRLIWWLPLVIILYFMIIAIPTMVMDDWGYGSPYMNKVWFMILGYGYFLNLSRIRKLEKLNQKHTREK